MVKVGVQLHPQHCTYQALAEAAREADRRELDSLWTWDHFYPLYGVPAAPMGDGLPADAGEPPERGDHFEGWTLLAAFAAVTRHVKVGLLVSCNSYRNPDLIADMARTVDHISGGRAVLGLGSGWYEKDYSEYGYEFGTASGRLKDLEAALPRIEARLRKLTPPPLQSPFPLMIGGGGEQKTLRLVAQHATMWNFAGSFEDMERKTKVLDDWCHKLGRDPAQVERTVLVKQDDPLDLLDRYLNIGIDHFIVRLGTPFDFAYLDTLQKWREKSQRS